MENNDHTVYRVNMRKHDEDVQGAAIPKGEVSRAVLERQDGDHRDEEGVLYEAHRLPASMSSSARRLREEAFDESSARIFCGVNPALRKFRAI